MVGSSILLSLVVQQLVAILVLSKEEVNIPPSTPLSWLETQDSVSFFSSFTLLFIYFWLHWVLFAAFRIFFEACGLLVAMHGLLSSCVSQVPEFAVPGAAAAGSLVVVHGLRCPMACGMWVLRPGIRLAPSASEGGFLTIGPPGKPLYLHSFSDTLDHLYYHDSQFFFR